MNLVIWVLIGLAAGRLAQVVIKDDWHKATAGNLVLGVLGAVPAAWVLQAVLGSGAFSIWTPIAALAGATVALWAGRSFTSDPILR